MTDRIDTAKERKVLFGKADAYVIEVGGKQIGLGLYLRQQEVALDAERAENERLREALRDMARQKRTDELETEYDVECADFEGGYDTLIDRARAALNPEGGA